MEPITIKNVVIITDCIDIAYNELHGKLVSQPGIKNIIDQLNIAPVVPVLAFSVVNASFCTRLMAEVFDHNVTLFVLVVHGVDSQPARIFGRTKTGLMFIGNNSGYFNWLIEDFGLEYLYKNNTTRMVNGHSFGGKYVQIPTAAHIISNQPLEDIGTRVTEDFLENFKIQAGTVVHIDNFGLIKIKSPSLKNLVHGQKLKLFVNGNEVEELIYSEKMKQEKTGEKVLFTGSSLAGLPEIAVVRSENSANSLNIKLGDIVSWQAI